MTGPQTLLRRTSRRVLAALALPTFRQVQLAMTQGVVDRSLDAAARAGEALCTADRSATLTGTVAAASSNSGNGSVAVTVGPDSVTLELTSGGTVVSKSVTFTLCDASIAYATANPDGDQTVDGTLDTVGDESAEVTTLGTFTGPANDLTITRTQDGTTAAATTANWEYMSVSYDSGAGPVTDTVFKTAGAATVGVLTRLSNTSVYAALSASQAFTLTVKYNGKSTGTTYVFSAVT